MKMPVQWSICGLLSPGIFLSFALIGIFDAAWGPHTKVGYSMPLSVPSSNRLSTAFVSSIFPKRRFSIEGKSPVWMGNEKTPLPIHALPVAVAPLEMSSTTAESQMLKGFLRGHKNLFDDSSVNNGNIVYLLRGADASQRLLYPIEIETNRPFLMGADDALTMFHRNNEAMQFIKDAVLRDFPHLNQKESVKEIFNEDMIRFHRVLQYGVATGLTKGFMRPEVLEYNAKLYHEIGMNYNVLESGIRYLKEFYKGKIKASHWQEIFEPCWSYLYNSVAGMKHHRLSKYTEGNENLRNFEREPEIGTMTPLIVQLKNVDISDVHGFEKLIPAVRKILCVCLSEFPQDEQASVQEIITPFKESISKQS
ncbi:hypothetical protein IE077_001103 [Cardiosporidium cionae]|uniref:Uncharacterized protein n=1 Tax=Cardiosporidium cionae TaxID=476202 RepID=A0ABQ7JGL8_9APIC|nr:hypothetical protein IE077_001103 [Cardiosporidium cionae]|eukprot:KAF8823034.1 hypothetical protein IE077_001103 [Cardiosporidium cionae]